MGLPACLLLGYPACSAGTLPACLCSALRRWLAGCTGWPTDAPALPMPLSTPTLQAIKCE